MDSYLGSIMTFAFNWTPMYFAACNGQNMQIVQNQALYALLGISFGGNGSTNFNLPDLRGRAPVHFGLGTGGTNRQFALPFGQDNETLAAANMPLHTHTIGEKVAGQTVAVTTAVTVNASSTLATLPVPTGNYWAKVSNGTSMMPGYSTPKNVTMASDAVQVTVSPTFSAANLAIGNAGNGTAFSLAQPSLPLNFCICTAGIFPTRT